MSQGRLPWRPELGTKGGAAFFVAEGNPWVGIDAAKTVEVGVEITGLNQNAMVFTEADVLAIYEEEAKANAEAVKAEFRKRFKLPESARVEDQNSRPRKTFKRLEKDFVESKMWDRVDERVAEELAKKMAWAGRCAVCCASVAASSSSWQWPSTPTRSTTPRTG